MRQQKYLRGRDERVKRAHGHGLGFQVLVVLELVDLLGLLLLGLQGRLQLLLGGVTPGRAAAGAHAVGHGKHAGR